MTKKYVVLLILTGLIGKEEYQLIKLHEVNELLMNRLGKLSPQCTKLSVEKQVVHLQETSEPETNGL